MSPPCQKTPASICLSTRFGTLLQPHFRVVDKVTSPDHHHLSIDVCKILVGTSATEPNTSDRAEAAHATGRIPAALHRRFRVRDTADTRDDERGRVKFQDWLDHHRIEGRHADKRRQPNTAACADVV